MDLRCLAYIRHIWTSQKFTHLLYIFLATQLILLAKPSTLKSRGEELPLLERERTKKEFVIFMTLKNWPLQKKGKISKKMHIFINTKNYVLLNSEQ